MSHRTTSGPWIQIVGSKKTGKTSLLEDLTRELVARGRRVCFIKHAHEAPLLDGTDTDTDRLRRAGAAVTILAGEQSTIVFRTDGGETLETIAGRDAPAGDIVLAEGFKNTPGMKIAIAGGDLDIEELGGVIAVVGDPPPSYTGRVFRPDDVQDLCDAIEDALAGPEAGWATSLVIDGRDVPLNTFVQKMIGSTLMGMSAALDGVEEGTVLEVRCRRVETTRKSGGA